MMFSSSMAKQASTTWLHTGAQTTNLASMDTWIARLLFDFHSNAKISSLRFGTAEGLEESVNTTSSSASSAYIMRRDSPQHSACMKTYMADGTTADAEEHPDTCGYDPRYTSWYQAGRSATHASTFTDTYDNSWLAAVTKACPNGGNCLTQDIVGVFACEWEISSVGDALAKLIDGFEGSLAVIDKKGIVLSTSSGITLEPALSCNDAFIVAASKETVASTKFWKLRWSGNLLRTVFIGLDLLSWKTNTAFSPNFPDVSAQYFGMMALERRQFYSEYEQARNTGLALVCFGLVFMGMIVTKFMNKTKENLLHSCDRNREVENDFEDALEGPHIKLLRRRFEKSAEALECYIKSAPIKTRDLQCLEGRSHSNPAAKQELLTNEALQWVAVSLLQDLALGNDIELHFAILLCSPGKRLCLMPLFRCFNAKSYWWLSSSTLSTLLWLQMVESGVPGWTKAALLVLICVDGALLSMFHSIRAWSFEINSQDCQGATKVVIVPGTFNSRVGAAWLYAALAVAAATTHMSAMGTDIKSSNTVAYILPVLILLRYEEIWPACFVFAEAVSAAGPIVYIWLCVLLLLSGMTSVLLHGKYTTGDDYTDSQFYDVSCRLPFGSLLLLIRGLVWVAVLPLLQHNVSVSDRRF